MDWKQAWSTTANTTNSALDSLAPVCVPFAARWDLEADRRNKLRTPEHLKTLMGAQKEHNAARSTLSTAKSQQAHRAGRVEQSVRGRPPRRPGREQGSRAARARHPRQAQGRAGELPEHAQGPGDSGAFGARRA